MSMPYIPLPKLISHSLLFMAERKNGFKYNWDRHQSSQCVYWVPAGYWDPTWKVTRLFTVISIPPPFPAETIKNVHSIANWLNIFDKIQSVTRRCFILAFWWESLNCISGSVLISMVGNLIRHGLVCLIKRLQTKTLWWKITSWRS